MDPVHERGSMDPVHILMDPVHGGGPWTRGPCFVLSRSEQSGFKPWLGTLCSILGQDIYKYTLLSQCLSPSEGF